MCLYTRKRIYATQNHGAPPRIEKLFSLTHTHTHVYMCPRMRYIHSSFHNPPSAPPAPPALLSLPTTQAFSYLSIPSFKSLAPACNTRPSVNPLHMCARERDTPSLKKSVVNKAVAFLSAVCIGGSAAPSVPLRIFFPPFVFSGQNIHHVRNIYIIIFALAAL